MLLAIFYSRDKANRQSRIFGIRYISKGLGLSKQAQLLIARVTRLQQRTPGIISEHNTENVGKTHPFKGLVLNDQPNNRLLGHRGFNERALVFV